MAGLTSSLHGFSELLDISFGVKTGCLGNRTASSNLLIKQQSNVCFAYVCVWASLCRMITSYSTQQTIQQKSSITIMLNNSEWTYCCHRRKGGDSQTGGRKKLKRKRINQPRQELDLWPLTNSARSSASYTIDHRLSNVTGVHLIIIWEETFTSQMSYVLGQVSMFTCKYWAGYTHQHTPIHLHQLQSVNKKDPPSQVVLNVDLLNKHCRSSRHQSLAIRRTEGHPYGMLNTFCLWIEFDPPVTFESQRLRNFQ